MISRGACLALLGAAFVGTCAAHAQDEQPPARTPGAPPGPVVRVVAADDLDVMGQCDALEAILHDAREAGASLVVLELRGNAGRLDVTNCLAGVLRRAGVPLAAYLSGGDDAKVGPPQLALALLAGRVVVAPNVRVEGAARGPADDLAPADTPWGVLAEELRGRLEPALELRAQPADLAGALTGACDGLRLVREGDAARIRVIPDAQAPGANPRAPGESLTSRVGGACALAISRQALDQAGLATARAATWREVVSALELGRLKVVEHALPAGAGPSRAEALDLAAHAKRALARAKSTLALPDPATNSLAPGRYRDAARRAEADLAEADRALDALAALFERVPEVLRTPGEDGLRRDRVSQHEAAWRRTLRDARSEAASLRAKADGFARR